MSVKQLTPNVHRPKESYVNHPDFNKRFAEAMEGAALPADKIPAGFKGWLLTSIENMSFPETRLPFAIYKEIIETDPAEMSFGLLQKAADLVMNSKPIWFTVPSRHIIYLEQTTTLIDAMRDIAQPIRDKVIGSLMALDSIKQ
jgi:hypothetical protein